MSGDSAKSGLMAPSGSNEGRAPAQSFGEALQVRSPLSGSEDEDEEEAKRRRTQVGATQAAALDYLLIEDIVGSSVPVIYAGGRRYGRLRAPKAIPLGAYPSLSIAQIRCDGGSTKRSSSRLHGLAAWFIC